MVKYGGLFSLLLVALATNGYAADFAARAERNGSAGGDGLVLRLELSDAEATGQPDLSDVQRSFQVLGSQTSSISKIINGVSSYSTTWAYTLVPNQPEQASIPAVEIVTTKGVMKTQAIPIAPSQALTTVPSSPGQSTVSAGAGRQKWLSFTATADKTELYKNEPTLVRYRLTSARSLRNVQVGAFSVKDALVEQQGQPTTRTGIVNGRQLQIVQLSYLVTPMKDGAFTIPPLVLQGEAVVPASAAPSRRRRGLPGFGDDDGEGPFAEMRKMMEGFDLEDSDMFARFSSMQPVTLASNPLRLKVLPAEAGMDPWLPTANLKISESWRGEQPRVGVPMTRTVTTMALGLAASQLPDFDSQFSSNADYKVYSDRPEATTTEEHGQVVSRRKDTFTVIPQQAGELRIPALRLAWWDTQSRSRRIASVPETVLRVLPEAGQSTAPPAVARNAGAVRPDRLASIAAIHAQDWPTWKWSALVALGLTALGGVLILLFKTFRAEKQPVPPAAPVIEPAAVKAVGRRDLEQCACPRELQRFMQAYSQDQWKVAPNASLATIFGAAGLRIAGFDTNKARDLSNRIEGALYASKPMNLAETRRELADLVFRSANVAASRSEPDRLGALNPS